VTSARTAVLVAAALVSACATVPPAGRLRGDSFSGRLALRAEAGADSESRSMTAAFDLTGRPESGQLDLSTPLGTVLGRARWMPGSVVLDTPQGRSEFGSLDALTREVLGESLPVAAMFDWLKGRPWGGAPSSIRQPPAAPGFDQLGWAVNLAEFDAAVLTAVRQRPPTVTVRVKLDRP
jgi:outer membrane lipoprotein LolB